MSMPHDVRWKQRFQSYGRGLTLLREALQRGPAALNQLEKWGAIQRFEYCLALWGEIDPLPAEAIASELDELPLPYGYDVKAFAHITLVPLREHIERVGILLYRAERSVPT